MHPLLLRLLLRIRRRQRVLIVYRRQHVPARVDVVRTACIGGILLLHYRQCDRRVPERGLLLYRRRGPAPDVRCVYIRLLHPDQLLGLDQHRLRHLPCWKILQQPRLQRPRVVRHQSILPCRLDAIRHLLGWVLLSKRHSPARVLHCWHPVSRRLHCACALSFELLLSYCCK